MRQRLVNERRAGRARQDCERARIPAGLRAGKQHAHDMVNAQRPRHAAWQNAPCSPGLCSFESQQYKRLRLQAMMLPARVTLQPCAWALALHGKQ